MRNSLGFYDESKMHGRVFAKLDAIRDALAQFARDSKVNVAVNRFYLANEEVSVNFNVEKQMYLVRVSEDGVYEITKTNKKSKLPPQKRTVTYQHITSGAFVELFTNNA